MDNTFPLSYSLFFWLREIKFLPHLPRLLLTKLPTEAFLMAIRWHGILPCAQTLHKLSHPLWSWTRLSLLFLKSVIKNRTQCFSSVLITSTMGLSFHSGKVLPFRHFKIIHIRSQWNTLLFHNLPKFYSSSSGMQSYNYEHPWCRPFALAGYSHSYRGIT